MKLNTRTPRYRELMLEAPETHADAFARAQGPWLDMMYWPTVWAERQLAQVLVQERGLMGYSTLSGGPSARRSKCLL